MITFLKWHTLQILFSREILINLSSDTFHIFFSSLCIICTISECEICGKPSCVKSLLLLHGDDQITSSYDQNNVLWFKDRAYPIDMLWGMSGRIWEEIYFLCGRHAMICCLNWDWYTERKYITKLMKSNYDHHSYGVQGHTHAQQHNSDSTVTYIYWQVFLSTCKIRHILKKYNLEKWIPYYFMAIH